mmetsp:Transcript_7665/g.27279  ORF Transcript_7665/g.27279 Transcript_7665/m.27279 type:complete len:358 (+) Transcript_7665:229-1302(+)
MALESSPPKPYSSTWSVQVRSANCSAMASSDAARPASPSARIVQFADTCSTHAGFAMAMRSVRSGNDTSGSLAALTNSAKRATSASARGTKSHTPRVSMWSTSFVSSSCSSSSPIVSTSTTRTIVCVPTEDSRPCTGSAPMRNTASCESISASRLRPTTQSLRETTAQLAWWCAPCVAPRSVTKPYDRCHSACSSSAMVALSTRPSSCMPRPCLYSHGVSSIACRERKNMECSRACVPEGKRRSGPLPSPAWWSCATGSATPLNMSGVASPYANIGSPGMWPGPPKGMGAPTGISHRSGSPRPATPPAAASTAGSSGMPASRSRLSVLHTAAGCGSGHSASAGTPKRRAACSQASGS